MEVRGISLILVLSGLLSVLQSAEVVLAELGLLHRLKSLVERWLLTFVVLAIDSRSSGLSEGFTEEILRFDLWDVTSIPWNVLRLEVLSGTTEPVVSLFGVVAVRNGAALLVDRGGLGVVFAGGIRRLALEHVHIEVRWSVACTHDNAVDITGSASVYLIFLGAMASVTRQVFFLEANRRHNDSTVTKL